jgi:hypothetical protein
MHGQILVDAIEIVMPGTNNEPARWFLALLSIDRIKIRRRGIIFSRRDIESNKDKGKANYQSKTFSRILILNPGRLVSSINALIVGCVCHELVKVPSSKQQEYKDT